MVELWGLKGPRNAIHSSASAVVVHVRVTVRVSPSVTDSVTLSVLPSPAIDVALLSIVSPSSCEGTGFQTTIVDVVISYSYINLIYDNQSLEIH
jgi:hypothetical protein